MPGSTPQYQGISKLGLIRIRRCRDARSCEDHSCVSRSTVLVYG